MRIRRAPIVLTTTAAAVAAVLTFRAREPVVVYLPPGCPGAVPSDERTVATGTAMKSKYGVTQVKATIVDGKITAVTALSLPHRDSRSLRIDDFAEPELKKHVLAEQTADVDAVTGATYTSASYKASLQYALDAAEFEAPSKAPAKVAGIAKPNPAPKKCSAEGEAEA